MPLAALIHDEVLDERRNHRASAVRFRDDLEEHMSPDYADETLKAVIGWGRYADLYAYDEEADQFFLEEDQQAELPQARAGCTIFRLDPGPDPGATPGREQPC